MGSHRGDGRHKTTPKGRRANQQHNARRTAGIENEPEAQSPTISEVAVLWHWETRRGGPTRGPCHRLDGPAARAAGCNSRNAQLRSSGHPTLPPQPPPRWHLWLLLLSTRYSTCSGFVAEVNGLGLRTLGA